MAKTQEGTATADFFPENYVMAAGGMVIADVFLESVSGDTDMFPEPSRCGADVLPEVPSDVAVSLLAGTEVVDKLQEDTGVADFVPETSRSGPVVAKVLQSSVIVMGRGLADKEASEAWLLGDRRALVQCSYKGFALCVPPLWAKPEHHKQIGLSKVLKLICFLQARWRLVSSQDIVRIFKLKYDVCEQDTENQLRILCERELISGNDQFITMHANAGVIVNRIL